MASIIGRCPVRLWGMTSAERLRRSLARAGVTEVRQGLDVQEVGDASPSDDGRRHLLVRDDHVFDAVLIADLARAEDTVLTTDAGLPVAAIVGAADVGAAAAMLQGGGSVPAGLRVVGPGGLSSAYNNALRKREAPYLMRLDADTLPAVERRMFAGSYKGVTDLVTKYVWPAPALRVTRWCAGHGITPNMVTWLSLVLVLLAMAAFWHGWFLSGLVMAWGMTFLDTVDGKLARVTMTSTKLGNVFDHGIDLVHPPFWYWAWMVGLAAVGLPLDPGWLVLAIVVAGYVLQRLQEGLFIALFGLEIHIWRRFDSWFRLITARRNPNLLLLTAGALAGRPDLGMLAVAVWTIASLLVHTVQILQALPARRSGPLVSWLAR
ncbi:CDP-alcohol phosphatidyltransferase family protein [Azospirillum picis]|uniref:Phosphatidylglycerophosphate synthase n=1 Tax=Azospirillum picis TaxID=488438 RepID=A0ABU0MN61_9PROT|nr:CDP-alcohol phosphatidyltransferase family protein [Azospirillum picis]MBP2301129.1 phosphatidylglycerophosphate synthase [Azospirillum picis]MDQ0534909.1 phosphatidylglycerophosphate synthase [Azospirillum picis]